MVCGAAVSEVQLQCHSPIDPTQSDHPQCMMLEKRIPLLCLI